eukprot:TRINITY_DN35005_c0_g1_i1.p1 TRINITY_DN35005_c0_g1~~TRINITY_DN35005_c0_g1_i1.p1  ORF type:complete len:344 (-),score=77.41 TRINITY_DN35005_c0_g1_i1:766-1797(-)
MFDFDDLDEAMEKEAPKEASSPAHAAADAAAANSRYRCRWGVNVETWNPIGDDKGAEFQFLLGLIEETDDREQVMKYKFLIDKKRTLISRLLLRKAASVALGHDNYRSFRIRRTKGKKPFLQSPLTDEEEAPNWNVNVSHEGCWVVCASEPECVVGVDVADLRRLKPNGQPIDFHKVFEDQLTAAEWRVVTEAGEDLDAQYEVFSRFWSAKEAFVKARGDGLGYELGKTEFTWTPLQSVGEGQVFEGAVKVEGVRAPLWRFVQHRMPGPRTHWVTVSRGPLTDIVDANGDFKQTFRRPQASFHPVVWQDALLAPSPNFKELPVAALVPAEQMEAYIKAGGKQP